MTYDEWSTSNDPETMLAFVRESRRASERQLRLFACACCRRIWHWLTDERCQLALETAEDYADSLASDADLDVAEAEAEDALCSAYRLPHAYAVRYAVQSVHPPAPGIAPDRYGRACAYAAQAAGEARSAVLYFKDDREEVVQGQQCQLLRCIFGPCLFRPLVPVARRILEWNDGLAVSMAQTVYEQRALPAGHLDAGRLAVLCDALLDAGSPQDHELLLHLRGPGPHVRGCAAVDCLLGRQ
jgi:hypothetical protein